MTPTAAARSEGAGAPDESNESVLNGARSSSALHTQKARRRAEAATVAVHRSRAARPSRIGLSLAHDVSSASLAAPASLTVAFASANPASKGTSTVQATRFNASASRSAVLTSASERAEPSPRVFGEAALGIAAQVFAQRSAGCLGAACLGQ